MTSSRFRDATEDVEVSHRDIVEQFQQEQSARLTPSRFRDSIQESVQEEQVPITILSNVEDEEIEQIPITISSNVEDDRHIEEDKYDEEDPDDEDYQIDENDH